MVGIMATVEVLKWIFFSHDFVLAMRLFSSFLCIVLEEVVTSCFCNGSIDSAPPGGRIELKI